MAPSFHTHWHRFSVCRISNRFEVVTEKVNNIPKTTQELVELIDFVRQSQTEIFPELIVQVEAAGKRLLFLLDYTILSSECAVFQRTGRLLISLDVAL